MTDTEIQNPARRYAPLMAVFGVMAATLSHAAANRDREPASGLQLAEQALATFFLARVVAHEKVGAVVREPFVEPKPGSDPADARGDAKQPTGGGLRYSVGELSMCTRCLGPWAASLVTFSDAFAPRHARIATRVLALAGANSLTQSLHATWIASANRDEASIS